LEVAHIFFGDLPPIRGCVKVRIHLRAKPDDRRAEGLIKLCRDLPLCRRPSRECQGNDQNHRSHRADYNRGQGDVMNRRWTIGAALAAIFIVKSIAALRGGEFSSWTWDNDSDVRASHAELEGKPMPTLEVSDWVNGEVS